MKRALYLLAVAVLLASFLNACHKVVTTPKLGVWTKQLGPHK